MANRQAPEDLKAVRAARARKRRRRRRKRKIILLFIELIILLVLAVAGFVVAKYSKFQKADFETSDIEINEGIALSGYTTFALFGGDSREGQLGPGTRTDTMMVVAIDNDTKVIRMASVYRDTLLRMEDGTYNKANHAYYEGGPAEAISMLNRNLDLDITDYVTVDFKALSDAIDTMGGLEIEVSDAEAQQMNKYVHETAKASGKTDEAIRLDCGGTYNLNGPQAVTYARLRKLEGGDYKRTERQRIVITKMFEKAKKMSLKEINGMIDVVFPQVSTSIDLSYGIQLAAAFRDYQLGDSSGFPFEKTDGIIYSSAGDCVVALSMEENVKELHQFLYPDLYVTPEDEEAYEAALAEGTVSEDGIQTGTTTQIVIDGDSVTEQPAETAGDEGTAAGDTAITESGEGAAENTGEAVSGAEDGSTEGEAVSGTEGSTQGEENASVDIETATGKKIFTPSAMVQEISDTIMNLTGAVRPQGLSWSWWQEKKKEAEAAAVSTSEDAPSD